MFDDDVFDDGAGVDGLMFLMSTLMISITMTTTMLMLLQWIVLFWIVM